MKLLHLAKRFVGSLGQADPPADDLAWVERTLLPGELALWRTMPAPDRRHSVLVATQVEDDWGDAPRELLAAALLHDVGKTASGLGTFGRVGATVVIAAAGHDRAARWSGRVGRYARHDQLGAELLAAAGADAVVIAWAREHHLPADRWTVDGGFGAALKQADDD